MIDNKEMDGLDEEQYLKDHIKKAEMGKKTGDDHTTSMMGSNNLDYKQVTSGLASDLKFFVHDINKLPCGDFYPVGTLLKLRPAEVAEIQAYSSVDDNNFFDIVDKMNNMLASCVRLQYPNGRVGTYLELRDQDRYYVIFMIRQLTFQKNLNLVVKKTCSCGEECEIPMLKDNFVNYKFAKAIENKFDPAKRCFSFTMKTSGKTYHMSPPTIGLQKNFTDYIIKQNSANKKPDMAFLKIVPYLLHDRTSITEEGIEQQLENFKTAFDNDTFQFLNAAVGKIKLGVEFIETQCKCGLEVRTDFTFPTGASGIFVDEDAFDRFID